MPNIVYFEIPADDVDRAKHFYQSVLGWKIEPTRSPLDQEAFAAMQYHDVSTGEAEAGALTMGGMYKRQTSELITNHVKVDDIDEVLAKVEGAGGTIVMPKMEIRGVGLNAIIQDTEGNSIGLLQAEQQ